MRLAKQQLDVGLFTARRDPHLHFWQQVVGLEFDHLARLGGGVQQHRHLAHGSIIKVNHARDPLPVAPPSGIARVRIACPDRVRREELTDPDGNRVLCVPPGDEGVTGIGIDLVTAQCAAHEHFWRVVMQFEQVAPRVYACGSTRIFVSEGPPVARCDDWRAPGWRYCTVQVHDCVAEHAGVLARGGLEGRPPAMLGDTVRYSFVRDPDGNYIEVSQRASLLGRERL